MYCDNDISRVLLTPQQIDNTVTSLANRISEDYADKNLLLVGLLKGSFVFMADLIRKLTVPCRTEFMAVSSYGSGTRSCGKVTITKDLSVNIDDCDVLVVEDILDTGITAACVTDILSKRNPASLRLCSFLDKPERRQVPITADYVGVTVPDEFVVGYGLDYDERYRNLDCLCVLKPEVYSDKA